MDAQISGMYLAHSKSYIGKHGKDVAITLVVVLAAFTFMVGTSYTAVVKQAKANWEQNKCNPIYMPFAGVIMPIPGQSFATTTAQNFDYCVQQDLSSFMSILLMPLEYVAFLILTSLDLLINIVVLTMTLIAKLKGLIGGNSASLFDKLAKIAVPMTLTVAKIRDALAKVNATVMTAVFTTLTVYEMIVSGVLSILTITVNLLLAVVSVIVVMFVIAMVLMVTPAFPIGIAMFSVASTAVIAVVIPTVIIYALLRIFVQETFGKTAVQPPSVPRVPKKKKKK
jgi:hypothetical protein